MPVASGREKADERVLIVRNGAISPRTATEIAGIRLGGSQEVLRDEGNNSAKLGCNARFSNVQMMHRLASDCGIIWNSWDIAANNAQTNCPEPRMCFTNAWALC